jgi:hypothetical protein
MRKGRPLGGLLPKAVVGKTGEPWRQHIRVQMAGDGVDKRHG